MMHVRFKKRYWKAHRLILRQAHCNIFPSCPYWILISVHPQSKKIITIYQSTLDLRAKTNLSFEVWWGDMIDTWLLFLRCGCRNIYLENWKNL